MDAKPNISFVVVAAEGAAEAWAWRLLIKQLKGAGPGVPSSLQAYLGSKQPINHFFYV
jgi:hypothetical protein